MKINVYHLQKNDSDSSIQVPTEMYLLLALEGQERTGGLLLGILNKGNLNTSPFCLWYSPSDTTAPATGLISPT